MSDRLALCLGEIPEPPQVRRRRGPDRFGERGEHLHRTIKSIQIPTQHSTTQLIHAKCFTSGALPADATGKLDVLGEDRHALAMDGKEVGVLKETDEVSFRRLLDRQHSGRLEPELGLEVKGQLAHKALEREPIEH